MKPKNSPSIPFREINSTEALHEFQRDTNRSIFSGQRQVRKSGTISNLLKYSMKMFPTETTVKNRESLKIQSMSPNCYHLRFFGKFSKNTDKNTTTSGNAP